MGEIKADLRVWSADQTRSVELTGITVDTGATYSVIPRTLLEELGVQVTGAAYAEMADGRVVQFDRGQARLGLNGDSAITTVLFATEGQEPLIGVVTLEELQLAADPVGGRLIPVRFIRI